MHTTKMVQHRDAGDGLIANGEVAKCSVGCMLHNQEVVSGRCEAKNVILP